jgi:hypothetical protein
MSGYKKYKSNILALRFMLNKACLLASQGTSDHYTEIRRELVKEFIDLEQMLEIEIEELKKEE